MDRRVARGLVVAVLVVVAGCVGPATTPSPSAAPTDGETATGSPTATPTPTTTSSPTAAFDRKVTVEGGELSFDAAAVYRRVVALHDLPPSAAPDVTVHVRNRSEFALTAIYSPSGFERAMGVEPTAEETAVAGLARGTDVYLYVGTVTDPAEREAVLAHEYVHVLQGATGAFGDVRDGVDGRATQEGRVETGITEGAATYVESEYRQRYLGQEPSRLNWSASRARRSAFGAFLVAPYVFGHRYVDRRVDSPAELPAVYESPPETTEQLLHATGDDGDPPRALTVVADTGDRWDGAGRRTKGELFARLVLEPYVDPDRAARAAAGWGADRLLAVRGEDGGRGHAWVTRWDDPGEADAFAAALRAALSTRGERVDGGWTVDGERFRLVRPAGDLVVVLVGDEAFVAAAGVAADGARVTVTVEGSGGSVGVVAPPHAPVPARASARPA